jgi:Mce-associated membrane protein
MRGLGIALLALVALGLISAMAVASTLFVLGSNKIEARNEQRAEYSAFARQIITNLTTLNPQNIDASIASFQDNTSGKAMEQAGQSMQQTVNMIKSENVSTKGTVISDAVTASDADSATVIMVSSWEMNQPNVTDQQTVLQTFRWKLDITKINGAMKLTNFEWVT